MSPDSSAAAPAAWSWSGHACRTCLSVLLRRDAPGGAPVFECGTCTASSRGTPDGICGCGMLPPALLRAAAGHATPAGHAPRFRCVPNDARSVTEPASVVIRWGVQA